MGGYTGEGFAKGIIGEVDTVKSAMKDMSMASILGVNRNQNETVSNNGSGNTYNFYPQKAIINEKDVVSSIRRLEVLYG
jgi:hypothetical protein